MKKTIIYTVILAAASAAFSGCIKDFNDYNTNPYEPQTLPVTSYMPGMIDCLASPEENPCQRNNTFWASFGGYVTTPNVWDKADNQFYLFNADDAWNQWSFNWYFAEHIYPNWFAIQRNTGGEGYLFQMAQLFRIYTMQIIASFQGPIPYTKIKYGDFYVPYDDEPTVWHAMMDDLDAVIAELSSAVGSGVKSPEFAGVDRIYRGDNVKWLKFANTLKLRMAMRISNAEPEFAQRKAEEAVASGVMEYADDSAYDNLDQRYQNGFYVLDKGWGGEVKANATITSYMNGYNDPRREKYFYAQSTGAGDEYLGVRFGVAGMNKQNYSGYSGLIWGSDDSYKFAKMPVMLASEAAFLRAEGALKGWNMGGSPQSHYEQGIRLSFEEWGASGAEEYLSNATRTPADYTDPNNSSYAIRNKSDVTIAWAEDGKELERIITQKWIAGFPNGHEAWSDFRRTGYPYLFPPKDNKSTDVTDVELGQRRLRFPLSEYQRNQSNVEAAVQLLGGKADKISVDLWWAQSENKYK